ncbi:MAG: PHP domain-containing protein [Thermodesulfobacteriota bacterium]|nr:PHP domain-containing protein [Thermodesulfobacteriota bacterium]
MTITIDFHVHTKASDGTMTPVEVVEYAQKKGLEAIAITDHDTVDGIREALERGREIGLDVLPGLEISAECPYGTMHLLGYCVDTESSFLKEKLKFLQKVRLERNLTILKKLSDRGIDLDYDKVVDLADGGQIGRLHFSRIMMMEGYTATSREAFHTYLKKGAPTYVDKFRFQPEEVIGLILDCKGIPVLAHPCTLGDLTQGVLKNVVERLVALGLQGIEIYYPDHRDDQIALYKKLADTYGLLITGGSDFHGENKPGVEIGVYGEDTELSLSLTDTLRDFRGKLHSRIPFQYNF